MKVALVNPPWSFEGSIYFGCREPHLPLEYGYARALLTKQGHVAKIFDAQLDGMSLRDLRRELIAFAPQMTVITTAPSYLFWRCAPPEMRVPIQTANALAEVCGTLVGVGPHASTSPRAALRKLSADAVVLGECEETLPLLASTDRSEWDKIPSIAHWAGGSVGEGEIVVRGGSHAADMKALPAIRWSEAVVRRHAHHHHRFDRPAQGPGAELESSRGCPYHCTFCAKDEFRDKFRKRPLETTLEELDRLIAQGAKYVYFVDEIFVPDAPLLEALAARPVEFGVQMRIDNWSKEMLDLLGRAGCVSIEAGVESITREGRNLLQKKCRLSTEQMNELLFHAKKSVAFVQANLIGTEDDPRDVAKWRAELQQHGVWSNEPVPLFPYPGSPDYARRWGPPDDVAWERAHTHYLREWTAFSDLQAPQPIPLADLERADGSEASCES